ncbi:hypothetical protein AB0L57_01015 [Nocardia sp. NPDC052254]|uniref:hypothetical protein n=1 Tax=Nocardia sp. NPDC052254 TaxID=3155681 RepID=UPI00343D7A4B
MAGLAEFGRILDLVECALLHRGDQHIDHDGVDAVCNDASHPDQHPSPSSATTANNDAANAATFQFL